MIRRISIGGKRWFLRGHDMDDFPSGSEPQSPMHSNNGSSHKAENLGDRDDLNPIVKSRFLGAGLDLKMDCTQKYTVYEHLARNTNDRVDACRSWLNILSNGVILFIVYTAFCDSVEGRIWEHYGIGITVKVLIGSSRCLPPFRCSFARLPTPRDYKETISSPPCFVP